MSVKGSFSGHKVKTADAGADRRFHFLPSLLNRWNVAVFLIAALVLVPLGVVLSSLTSRNDGVWQHLVQTLLGSLLLHTFWLVLGVASGTALLGVSLAWLTAACDYPGRKWFDWGLMLPLAIPSYVIAFVCIGLLDFTGPIQSALRAWLGPKIWFPEIRSTGGVISVMTLTLYPYVYLLARNAFLTQGRRGLEVAQSLGHSRWSGFFRVALPMARPWIAGGVMLVIMETLADFGTVSIFNYDTFTTAIYKAWFGLFSLSAAAQMASLLVILVFVLLLIEQPLRSRTRYTQVETARPQGDRISLPGLRGMLATAYCLLVLLAAFIVPMGQLLIWAYRVFRSDFDQRYVAFVGHSLFLAGVAALMTAGCGLVLVYANRLSRSIWTDVTVRIATLGYALPGSVLAVGLFIPIAWIDHLIIRWGKEVFGIQLGLMLNGTLLAMLLAYLVRFLAVGHHPLHGAMQRITPHIDEASRSLGISGVPMLRKVHLPMLRGGLLTAFILVFVDVMKEMPITLMTRPFGWDTLAIRIFEMTSEGEWERAALPAVALVLTGFIPVLFLTRQARSAGPAGAVQMDSNG